MMQAFLPVLPPDDTKGDDDGISASDWVMGIGLSIAASVVGGVSKLSIRKSWLLQEEILQQEQELQQEQQQEEDEGESNNSGGGTSTSTASAELHVTTLADNGYERLITPPPSPTDLLSRKTWRKRWSMLWVPYMLRGGGVLGMSILNPLFCVWAMNYASPSILAPFSGLTLVWIVLFSGRLLNEPPTHRQLAAAAFIVAGEVLVAIFGDHTNDQHATVQNVKDSYKDPAFLAYFIGIGLWMLLLAHWMGLLEWAKTTTTRTRTTAAATTTLSPLQTKLRRFAWGVSPGSLTGFQNFLKDSLTLLKLYGSQDKDGSTPPFPWVWLFFFMIGSVSTAFGGLLLLTGTMKRYDATYSSSMFVGSYIFSASIMAAVHYHTFSHLNTVAQAVLYPAGLLVLMGGVYLLIQDTSATTDTTTTNNNTAVASTHGENYQIAAPSSPRPSSPAATATTTLSPSPPRTMRRRFSNNNKNKNTHNNNAFGRSTSYTAVPQEQPLSYRLEEPEVDN